MRLWKRKAKKDGRVCCYLCGLKVYSKRKRMKLGVSYNLFDGEELLESSIQSIRQQVDYINVIYQKTSNFGQPANADVEPLLDRLKEQGFIDEIYLYEPVLPTSRENEIAKRDLGLKYAKKAGCTHFMSMDVDEYYKADELANAKQYILQNGIESSAVGIIEYLKEPTFQMVNGYTYTRNQEFYTFYVPFIMKINRFRKQKHGSLKFPCLVDPTRGIGNGQNFYLFSMHEIAMHHMSSIRSDLARKYQNSSFMNSPKEVQDYVRSIQQQILDFDFEKNKKNLKDYSMFNYSLVRKVDNIFNIHIDSKGDV